MNKEKFIIESNMMEGILRPPTVAELVEFDRFIALDHVTVDEMVAFVRVYQPNARLRDVPGLDVIMGSCRPMAGGERVREELVVILYLASMSVEEVTDRDAFMVHMRYEKLHPFTDGNGRSGRMLWAWMMREIPWATKISFLHRFYYQTLQFAGRAQ